VWAFTLALLTCLGIDFSNPLLPGVVRFGEEESVHALRAERSRTDERPTRTLPRPPEPAGFIDLDETPPRLVTVAADGASSLRSAMGRPRGSIAAPRATPAAEDH
jgi:hypothetical protein